MSSTVGPRISDDRAGQRARQRRRGGRLLSHLGLLVAAVVFGYPLLWMVIGAGKSMADFFVGLWWFTSPYRFANFADAWSVGAVGRSLLNSVFVTGTSIALNLLVAYPLAYALARMRFGGQRVLYGAYAVCLFVPVQLMVIPLFSLEKDLNLLDTYWGLILPYAATTMPFSVVFITAFFRTIPKELEEAAILDGASRFRIMTRIMLPLSLPAFATSVVFGFLHTWNEFLIALTLTHSAEVRTLPLGLLNFMQQQDQPDYAKLFAALAISTVPVLAVFVACQRQFLSGLMAGATKL